MRCDCCYPGAESRMSKTIAVDGDAALRLLWHALAWGSGVRQRKNHQRMDSVAADLIGPRPPMSAASGC